MFVFSSLIKSEVLLVMKPPGPCMGPTKEYEIVIKANRTDLLTEVSLFVSLRHAEWGPVQTLKNLFTNMRLTEQTDFNFFK